MRNRLFKTSGLTVFGMRTLCDKLTSFSIGQLTPQNIAVYKDLVFTSSCGRVLPVIIPSKKQLFQAVNSVVLPTIHKTYNYKLLSKLINSNEIVRGVL
jgi:hypothetical protein